MRYIFVLFICLWAQLTFSQVNDTIKISAELSNATVYYGYGAVLQHSTRPQLRSGVHQVLIDGIALQPDLNSLQLSCPEHVTILSYQHRIYTRPLVKPSSSLAQKQADSIAALEKKSATIANSISIDEDVLKRITGLIENNFVTIHKKPLSTEDLVKLTEYYTEKVKVLRNRVFEQSVARRDIEQQMQAIRQRMTALPEDNADMQPKTSGQLILQVQSERAGIADFDISYFTRNAGWIPAYDIRMKSLDNSLKLVYKATVQQTTGLDWKRVKLNLSTSNPNQSNTVPELIPSYVQLYVPQLYNIMEKEAANQPATLESIVVQSDKYLKRQAARTADDNVSDYLTLKESQLNINFEIDLPYDIPSDGKPYKVMIKDEMVPATFKHFSVPKLDTDAFLLAQLNRWDSLGLLPGEAGIIMDNVYLGKSFINPNLTSDTLSLSMGRDKRIAITRKKIKDFAKTSGKSDLKTETNTYEIMIRNNKKQPATLEVNDQFPISRVSDLEVKLTDEGGATVNKETGLLTWNVKLLPGESKTLRFSYTLRYPKEKTIQSIE